MNDWIGFRAMMLSELKKLETTYGKGKRKKPIMIRWHSSGDFFSEEYLKIAYDIAKATPDITHYAYTKHVSLLKTNAKNRPENFVINFSIGSQETNQIDTSTDKFSDVVPEEVFSDFIEKVEIPGSGRTNKHGKVFPPSKKWAYKSESDKQKCKTAVAYYYDIDPKSMLTYDEMMRIPYDVKKNNKPKYNVIVKPGDGDVSAMRKDVLGTYLLIH
jgi:hypothetical protein